MKYRVVIFIIAMAINVIISLLAGDNLSTEAIIAMALGVIAGIILAEGGYVAYKRIFK